MNAITSLRRLIRSSNGLRTLLVAKNVNTCKQILTTKIPIYNNQKLSHHLSNPNLRFDLNEDTEVNDFLDSSKINFDEAYELFKEKVKPRNLSKSSFYFKCASALHGTGNIQGGLQFMEYLKKYVSTNEVLLVYPLLMSLLASGGKENQNQILQMYCEIESSIDILPHTIISYVVEGLCATNEWKRALEIADMVTLDTNLIFISVIVCAVRNNVLDVVNSFVDRLTLYTPLEDVLWKPLFECVRDKNLVFTMFDFINLLQRKRIYLSEEFISEISTFYWNSGFDTTNPAQISLSGICQSCKYQFASNKLTPEENEVLRERIFNKLMVKSDAYLESSPKEIKRFLAFIKSNGPFSVVIDSLNLSLCTKTPNKNFTQVSINRAVDFFYQKQHKVLVIGRRHIGSNNTNMTKNCSWFFVDNDTNDDLFLLLAVCSNGPNTYLVTNDLLRNHGNKLDLHNLYFKWIDSIRVTHTISSYKTYFQLPGNYKHIAVGDDTSYHIPYKVDNNTVWLCVHKPTDSHQT